MTGTERVTKTILGEPTDRQPIYGWVSANLGAEITNRFGSVEAFEDKYEFDIAHIFGGPPVFKRSVLDSILREEGMIVKLTDVIAIGIEDKSGSLAKALEVLKNADIAIEYLYAFMARTEKHAYVVLRVENNEAAEEALVNAGFKLIKESDISKL